MKFAFFVLTDFQLFNVLKFVMTDCENSKGNGDLYLGDNLKEAERKRMAILSLGFFSNVYIVHTLTYARNEYIRKLLSAARSLNQNIFSSLIKGDGARAARKEKYSIAVLASAELHFQMFWNYFQPREIYMIEDGTGSYYGDIVQSTINPMRRIIGHMLGYKPKFTKLYVNNRSICKSNMSLEICEIAKPNVQELFSSAVFVLQDNCFHDTYNGTDWVYLQQPLDGNFGESVVLEREVVDMLKTNFRDRLIFRRHPSMKSEKMNDCKYDEDYDVWELVASKCLTENNVLIGSFSTAQMTPKQLFDKEPYIVLLFKLLNPDKDMSKIEQMCQDFKGLYRDASKIIIPRTIEDLKKFLCKINA